MENRSTPRVAASLSAPPLQTTKSRLVVRDWLCSNQGRSKLDYAHKGLDGRVKKIAVIRKTMAIETFEPRLDDSHRFAVALPYGNGDGRIIGVSPLQAYPTLDALEQGFSQWNGYAEGRKISRPVKIEKVTGSWAGENECRIL